MKTLQQFRFMWIV